MAAGPLNPEKFVRTILPVAEGEIHLRLFPEARPAISFLP
jgi:hypothetical protein